MKASQKTTVGSMKSRLLLASTIAVATAFVGTRVLADDATDIEQFYWPAGTYAQYDNASGDYPVITALASQPGTFGGHLYTGWSLLAQDSTGALDLFASAFTITNLGPASANAGAAGTPYTATSSPALGDALNVGGQWSPFHQIPEMHFVTTVVSHNYI